VYKQIWDLYHSHILYQVNYLLLQHMTGNNKKLASVRGKGGEQSPERVEPIADALQVKA